GRKIQFHGIGINRTAAARTMLLHPRDDLSSPCCVACRSRVPRDGTNSRSWRRERVFVIRTTGRKVGCQDVMVHKGRGVPATVNARKRLTAERASHGPVRRFSPGVG